MTLACLVVAYQCEGSGRRCCQHLAIGSAPARSTPWLKLPDHAISSFSARPLSPLHARRPGWRGAPVPVDTGGLVLGRPGICADGGKEVIDFRLPHSESE